MRYTNGLELLSEVVYLRTYAGNRENGTKESWTECVDRLMAMHKPRIKNDRVFNLIRGQILKKAVMPAMRSLQFAGSGILRENTRIYNCSYQPIVDFQSFAEGFFILMCGTGWGYSVRRQHVEQLPIIKLPSNKWGIDGSYLRIPDTKEGWADSIARLCEEPNLIFDYSLIRPAGSPISTGGTASGSEALKIAHERIRIILLGAVGRRLTPLECFDIACHIADGVVVGGVRRAATIALFDHDEEEMLTAKSGPWWEINPQRARANVSVAAVKSQLTQEQFNTVLDRCFASGAGEPGLYFVEHEDWGTQPCGELALEPYQFCNLADVNAEFISEPEALEAAAYLAVLQATYMDFGYLRPEWKAVAVKHGLVGIGLTGIAKNWEDVEECSKLAGLLLKRYVREAAASFDMPVPPRVGCVKPSGTSSAFLATTSGIHGGHGEYYLRRVRLDKSLPITSYLQLEMADFIEDDKFNPALSILSLPCKGEGIMRQDESAIGLLERSRFVYDNWIMKSHIAGEATHNVSITVNYKDDEKDSVRSWMWANRDSYNGISLLPYDGGTYVQAPFEPLTKEAYESLFTKMSSIDLDLDKIVWSTQDERGSESACLGGSCEII